MGQRVQDRINKLSVLFLCNRGSNVESCFRRDKTTKGSVKTDGQILIKVKYTSVSGAYQYQIYRSAKRNKGYKLVKTVSSSQKSWTNKKLKRNKKYYYKVRVKCKAGNIYTYSEFSRIKSKRVKKVLSGNKVKQKEAKNGLFFVCRE